MERGGREEEAGRPPGEHVKPHELLEQNMDSKTLHLYAQAIYSNPPHSQCFACACFQISNTYFSFYTATLLLIIVLRFPG